MWIVVGSEFRCLGSYNEFQLQLSQNELSFTVSSLPKGTLEQSVFPPCKNHSVKPESSTL
jgi:hypothetical protein